MTRERILTLLGYNTFFWLMFWLCAYWSFPYERLAAFITDKVAESGSGYTMEIGALSPYWLTGVELEQVKIQKAAASALATPPDEKGKTAPSPTIRIDSAHARLGLFSLLFGSKSLSFDAELADGELDGTFADNGEEQKVVATLAKVDLSKLGLLESLISLPMKGMLTGEFDLTLSKQPSKTAGTVKLSIHQLTVGDGKAKFKLGTMGGLTIDPIAAGEVALELDVKEGVGTIKRFNTSGPDLKLEGSGDIRFAQPLSRSRLGVLLRLKLTDTYKNKTPRTKTMFALLEGTGSPQLAAARTSDGAYQLRLTGTFSSLRPLPAGQQSLGAAGAANLAPGAPAAADDDDP
ncbi:MAG: ral secretion pathway protein [Myxococcaceae bacterium]|nr:ral secretion pathway protein [Myxococcaceae bacterium]